MAKGGIGNPLLLIGAGLGAALLFISTRGKGETQAAGTDSGQLAPPPTPPDQVLPGVVSPPTSSTPGVTDPTSFIPLPEPVVPVSPGTDQLEPAPMPVSPPPPTSDVPGVVISPPQPKYAVGTIFSSESGAEWEVKERTLVNGVWHYKLFGRGGADRPLSTIPQFGPGLSEDNLMQSLSSGFSIASSSSVSGSSAVGRTSQPVGPRDR